MANTKIPSELIPDDAITSSHVADDAITAAHIDSTATGMTLADLTVDTSTLKVDATNNRVGIGTASPTVPLHISSTGHTQYKQHRQSSGVGTGQEMKFAFNTADGTEEVYGSIYTDIKANTNGAESGNIALRVADAGSLSYVIHGSGGGDTKLYADGATIMTLKDGGSVGVGTDSPSNQFTIYRSGTETTASIHSNGQSELRFVANNAANTWIQAGTGPSSSQVPMYFTGMYGTNNTMTIDTANARVGIGTTSPGNNCKLHVNTSLTHHYSYEQSCGQGTFYMGFGNVHYYHIIQSGSNNGFYFGSACVANGGFSTYSDERIKENINTIDSALDKVALMDGITFTWKDTEKHGSGKQFGVTAQNMLEVDSELPVLAGDADATQEEIDDTDIQTDLYTFDYARLTPYFIEAIKELKTKLEAAEARITELEG